MTTNTTPAAFIPHQWKAVARAVDTHNTGIPTVTMRGHHVIIARALVNHLPSVIIDYDHAPAIECGGLTVDGSQSALLWDSRHPVTAHRSRVDCGGIELTSDYSGDVMADYLTSLQTPGREVAAIESDAIYSLLPHTEREWASAVLTGVSLRDGLATATDGKTLAQAEVPTVGECDVVLAPWAIKAMHKAPGVKVWHVCQIGPSTGSLIGHGDGYKVTIRGPVLIDGTYPPTANVLRTTKKAVEQTLTLDVSEVRSSCAEAQRGLTPSERRSLGTVSIVVGDGSATLLATPTVELSTMRAVCSTPHRSDRPCTTVYHVRAEYLRLHAVRAKTIRLALGPAGKGVIVEQDGQPDGLIMPVNMPDEWAKQAVHLAKAHGIATEGEDPGRHAPQPTEGGAKVRSLKEARRLADQARNLLDDGGIPVSAAAARQLANILGRIAGD